MSTLAPSTEMQTTEVPPRAATGKSRLNVVSLARLFRRARVQPARADLTSEELNKRLCLNSPLLVRELHETALRQIQYETGRQTRLDAKANTLLTAVGLSLTVAFTFGGQFLIANSTKINKQENLLYFYMVMASVAIALISGLASSFIAVKALRVNNSYRTVDEDTVFNDRVLQKADQAADEEGNSAPEDGLAEYRRYMIIQLWQIAQAHSRAHDVKAQLVRRGQSLFMVFLVAVLLICASLLSIVFG